MKLIYCTYLKVGDKVVANTSNSRLGQTSQMTEWYENKTILEVIDIVGDRLVVKCPTSGLDFLFMNSELLLVIKGKGPKQIKSWSWSIK